MKVKAFVTKYAYWLFLAGLSALLCATCFTDMLYPILIYLGLCAIFFTPEQLIGTWIFFYCFDGLLLDFVLIRYYLLFLLAGHYFYGVIEHRQPVNWRLLLVTMALAFLIVLRAWQLDFWSVTVVLSYLAFFLVYEQRKQFAMVNLVKVLAVGLIVSGLLGLLYNVSPYLQSLFLREPAEYGSMEPYAHEYYRFQGVTAWSTQYAGLATVALCGLLLLRYQKRINHYWFYGLFVPVFIFGYQTLTRTFLLCMGVALSIFAIFCWLRDRKQSWRELVPLAGMLMVVAIVFFTATMGNFERIFHDNAMEGNPWGVMQIPPEEWEAIKNGSVDFYEILGRKDIWSFYASDFVSSFTTVLLGRGVTHVRFSGHTAHNWYLYFAWQYGLVGIIIFVMLLGLMVNWRGWRTKQFWLRLAPCLIFLVPVLLQGMFDDNGYWAQICIVLMIVWCREQPRWRVAA